MSIEQEARDTRTASVGWMIQRVAGRLNHSMETKLSEHQLTLQQFAVMMTALERDGLTQTEIGEGFGMPAYAISRAIDHLENVGLLERRAHPTSRRAYTIHATDQGRALSHTLFSIVRDVNEELASPLTERQRIEFRKLLEKLIP